MPTQAMTDAERKLLARVEALADDQIRLTKDLIAIPTVNPYSGDASAATEAPGQDWIEDRFKSLGGSTRRIPVPEDIYAQGEMIGPPDRKWDNRENVVSEWQFGDGGRTIILNDHMDTVGAEHMDINPYDPVIKDGKIYGRGTSDTKGNMIMGLIAVQALLQDTSGLKGRIVFESVVDEECDGAGAGTLACCLAGITGDMAIVLDGAFGGTMHNGCNGIATARVRSFGQAGHASTGKSVNAIDTAFVAKQAVEQFEAEYRAQHPRCFGNVGVMRAGSKAGSVPNVAELQINFSYVEEDARAARDQTGVWGGGLFRERFAQAMARIGETDPWFKEHPAEVSWIKDMYPFECDPNGQEIQTVLGAASEVWQKDVKGLPMPAWFDGAHLAMKLGIPTLAVGHGAVGTAHTANEYAEVNSLLNGAKVVALALSRLLTQP